MNNKNENLVNLKQLMFIDMLVICPITRCFYLYLKHKTYPNITSYLFYLKQRRPSYFLNIGGISVVRNKHNKKIHLKQK